MFDFFICRSCDFHGSIDRLQTGFPTDLYPDEFGADDIPGGEEFYERILGHEL